MQECAGGGVAEEHLSPRRYEALVELAPGDALRVGPHLELEKATNRRNTPRMNTYPRLCFRASVWPRKLGSNRVQRREQARLKPGNL